MADGLPYLNHCSNVTVVWGSLHFSPTDELNDASQVWISLFIDHINDDVLVYFCCSIRTLLENSVIHIEVVVFELFSVNVYQIILYHRYQYQILL